MNTASAGLAVRMFPVFDDGATRARSCQQNEPCRYPAMMKMTVPGCSQPRFLSLKINVANVMAQTSNDVNVMTPALLGASAVPAGNTRFIGG
jgi:hypothetical protein